MSSHKYFTILTQKGLSKQALAHDLDKTIDLLHVIVGDSDGEHYEPTPQMKKLKRKVYKAEVSKVYLNENNDTQIIVEAMIPNSVGDFYIREVGILDSDGELFALGNYPETYKPRGKGGYAKELYLRIIIGFSSTKNITLFTDSASFVTPKDLEGLAKSNMSNVSSDDMLDKISQQIFSTACPVGSVFAYMGKIIPDGYLLLDGSSIGAEDSDANYRGEEFYNLYKSFVNDEIRWNNLEKIHIPDCRGRAIIGAGQAQDLSDRSLADTGGAETHTLSVSEMPHHTHDSRQYLIADKNARLGTHKGRWMGGFHSVTHQGEITSAVGGNQSHNNMPPWIAMNYIIKY